MNSLLFVLILNCAIQASWASPSTSSPVDLFTNGNNETKPSQKKVRRWTPSEMGKPPLSLQESLNQSQFLPLEQRLDNISKTFLGTPYRVDPLGEGVEPDADPFVRYDAFDCLTFVEEVLALAHSSEAHLAAQNRLSLRYRSIVPRAKYSERNHFMEMQWIPNAIESGWLEDITHQFYGLTKRTRVITNQTWRDWGPSRTFKMMADQFPTGEMSVEYIPIAELKDQISEIPHGSLLIVVREDIPTKPLWITHIGFVFHGKRTVLRHATKLGDPKVKDTSLQWYLNHVSNYKYWKASGFMILKPKEFGPRQSRLRHSE